MAESFGLSKDTAIVPGIRDSNAAFFATPGTQTSFGKAFTSLRSSLGRKQLSQTYVEDADRAFIAIDFQTLQTQMRKRV
jgi:sugar (pentulose or hexulose) kinase